MRSENNKETRNNDSNNITRTENVSRCFKDETSNHSFQKENFKNVLYGVDLGDINHSKESPMSFRQYFSAEVKKGLENFFHTRLNQTAFKPPINVQEDK